jgi:hypothetical protein
MVFKNFKKMDLWREERRVFGGAAMSALVLYI